MPDLLISDDLETPRRSRHRHSRRPRRPDDILGCTAFEGGQA